MDKSSLSVKKSSGFTLIEVLLAGFILFLVLTSMSQVYSGALLTSEKADRVLKIASAVPSIRASVSEVMHSQMGNNDRSGEGVFGLVKYRWEAKLSHTGRPSRFLQEDQGREIRYFLWDVELRLQYKSAERTYIFSEVTW